MTPALIIGFAIGVSAKQNTPSPDVLRQLLRYEPETGKLWWKERGAEWFSSSTGRPAEPGSTPNGRLATIPTALRVDSAMAPRPQPIPPAGVRQSSRPRRVMRGDASPTPGRQQGPRPGDFRGTNPFARHDRLTARPVHLPLGLAPLGRGAFSETKETDP